MRILYHHRTLGDGAEGIHIAEIVKCFRRLGHEVRVVSLIGESTNVRSKPQQRWTNIAKAMPGFVYELGEMAYNIRGYSMLSQAIKDFQPDFLYDRYISYNYSAVAAARHHGIPVVVEVNSPYSYQKKTFDERLYFKNLIGWFERKICNDANRVIVVSTPLKDILMDLGVRESQITVMPNGADPDVFHPSISGDTVRKQWGLEGKVVVGFTGILRPWHGLDLLIEAFGKLVLRMPHAHLVIIGDGPIRPDLENLIEARGLTGHVTITGRQPHDQIRSFVAATDVCVSPRATAYASPMKVLEYMAMGKAVLAPDMGNIRDIFVPRVEGMVFEPENVDSLATELEMLMQDASLRHYLGHMARKKIEAERTWMHNAQAVIDLVSPFLKTRTTS